MREVLLPELLPEEGGGGVWSWGMAVWSDVWSEGLVLEDGCLVRDQSPPPQDGYCHGRYASYWNAFLPFMH